MAPPAPAAAGTAGLRPARTRRDPALPFHCRVLRALRALPRDAWADRAAYDATARKLAGLFRKNFEPYATAAGPELSSAGPAA